ncbi:MAG: sensor domain-containing phosphodiesterase, partial [Firmicutes bacterium]|nr:sensor domain-containing phosphodiesterase [Bacillota bacterium]
CYNIIQGLDAPCPFCSNNKLIEGIDYRWEHYNEKLNKWFDNKDTLLNINGRLCQLEIAKDISVRREKSPESCSRLTMEDVLFRCLTNLTSNAETNKALDLFLKDIGSYYQAARVYIMEFDPDGINMSNTFEWCAPGMPSKKEIRQHVSRSIISGWMNKFEKEGEFSIHSIYYDLEPDSEDYKILKEQGVVSLMAAPLLRREKIVGYIAVTDPGQHEGNLLLLRSVAEFVLAQLDRRRLVTELEHMSYTDIMTGLYNRNRFNHILKEYDGSTTENMGVVTISINGMKVLNDKYGHSYGDHIIIKTGKIIADNLSVLPYRISGDEFAALYENIDKDVLRQEVLKLRKAFDAERDFTVSIGCAWDDEEISTQKLLHMSNELLAAEKQSYYQSVLLEGHNESYSGMFGEVAREIENNRFVVYYQPQVDLRSGEIIGAEALVRKLDEKGGVIPPNKFIPVYEMEGIVSYVDLFVLKTACDDIKRWNKKGSKLRVSVNFSRVTLMQPNIVDSICNICEEAGVSPENITIEVTESVSKIEPDFLKRLISEIKGKGFGISLDDFGSEYSNLSLLSAVKFDEIKFDRSLVSAIEGNANSRAILEGSIKICRELKGTSSLAEGIETEEQKKILREYKCDYGQGYYFSKPVPVWEFEDLVKTSFPDVFA